MSSPLIRLHEHLDPDRIFDLRGETKLEVLQELCDRVEGHPRISDANALRRAIFAREELVSTGIGLGVAVPHVKIPEVADYVVAVGRKQRGIEFDALDGQPVRLVFLIAASESQTAEFVRMLARVVRLVKKEATRVRLLESELPDEFIQIVREDDEQEGT